MNYEYLASMVKVSIPSFQESKTEANTIYYTLQLVFNEKSWSVTKRFSQFDALFNGLKAKYHELPSLPKKSFIFKMTERELQARRMGLEEFLQKIVIRTDLMTSDLVKGFLQLEKNASQVMVNPPKLTHEYSIEGNTKGIRDYVYFDDKGVFYLATADVSPVSRFNARVTNTKLPWENEGSTKFMEVGSVECWQADPISSNFSKVWSKGYPQQAICLSFQPTSRRLLVGLEDGVIDFILVGDNDYTEIACVRVHQSRVQGLTYDPLNNIVYSVSRDKIFRASHGSSLAMVMSVPHRQQLLSLLNDAPNKRIFVGSKAGEVIIYDVSQPQKPKLLVCLNNNKGGAIRSLCFDSNRNYLFSGSYDDGELNVFDLNFPGKEKLAHLTATLFGKDKVRAIAWNAKKLQIMSGSGDGSVTFWNAQEGKPICM